ncbi:MAG TPA: hypothetical protein VFY16_07970 [Gemmatimonadaceae bacterium]|nr:hypothetical protein [Gemmatimonadaceae bacterium]
MSSSTSDLRQLLDDFVAGAPFWPFWNAFMEFNETFEPERVLSPAGQQAYDHLYELIYMGVPDPVSARDEALGVIGAAELRVRLGQIRLETADGRVV